MKFFSHSGIHSLVLEQKINIGIDQCWEFFSNPQNLSKITPQKMGFKISSEKELETYAGQIITYEIQILPFLKTNWVTEITHLKEKEYFVDEQRIGPYKMWHHEHIFKRIDEESCLVIDKLSYKLPFGFFGNLAHFIFVKSMLRKIFSYRADVLIELFEKN
ncbi:MAG: SRPBCC family protein [Marinifilaceae bacterium]|jgi:ligand-binding SRPBCC domain-containing protein|nr:SRPBCC family protein [Marinifilaceae bacterium]